MTIRLEAIVTDIHEVIETNKRQTFMCIAYSPMKKQYIVVKREDYERVEGFTYNGLPVFQLREGVHDD